MLSEPALVGSSLLLALIAGCGTTSKQPTPDRAKRTTLAESPAAADGDHDTVADSSDRCPGEPEDLDGYCDADGCPDYDNDADRILDADDACPNAPETFNGIEDEDGCPDQGTRIVEENILFIESHPEFASNSKELEASSLPVVDAIAAIILGQPAIDEVAIVGYAEPGERTTALLSLERAETVRRLLVDRGVSASSITVHGAGHGVPSSSVAPHRRVAIPYIARYAGDRIRHWDGKRLVEHASPQATIEPPAPSLPPCPR